MTADIKAYIEDKSVETIATNLEGAGYGLVVPQYVADAGIKRLERSRRATRTSSTARSTASKPAMTATASSAK